jgi:hypothetical protein
MAVAGATALDASEPELARRAAIVVSLGLGADAPLQLRLARREGRTIGIASWFVHGEIALGPAPRRAGRGAARWRRARAGAGGGARGAPPVCGH